MSEDDCECRGEELLVLELSGSWDANKSYNRLLSVGFLRRYFNGKISMQEPDFDISVTYPKECDFLENVDKWNKTSPSQYQK